MGIVDWFQRKQNWRIGRRQMSAGQFQARQREDPEIGEHPQGRKCGFSEHEIRREEKNAVRSASGRATEDTQYSDAVRIVLIESRVTVSLLQRRLRVGFGRACQLVDRVHLDRIVDSTGKVVGSDY